MKDIEFLNLTGTIDVDGDKNKSRNVSGTEILNDIGEACKSTAPKIEGVGLNKRDPSDFGQMPMSISTPSLCHNLQWTRHLST